MNKHGFVGVEHARGGVRGVRKVRMVPKPSSAQVSRVVGGGADVDGCVGEVGDGGEEIGPVVAPIVGEDCTY